MLHILLRILLIFILVVAGFTLLLLWKEREIVYAPMTEYIAKPTDFGLDYSAVNITSSDGEQIHAWYMPHAEAKYTILFLHGNAGNISTRLYLYSLWHQDKFNVLALDYRGFGHSTGLADEAGLHADAQAAYNYLHKQKAIPAQQIIICGRSLGAAVAAHLAHKNAAAALILETPFTSLGDMTDVYYPWLPHLRFLTHNKFATNAIIHQINIPTMIIAASEDDITPHRMAEELYKNAGNGIIFRSITGNHSNYAAISTDMYMQSWQLFIKQLSVHDLDTVIPHS
ncbi:MAG: alpha/beta fold hydrolase [Mariprofundales bacterium]